MVTIVSYKHSFLSSEYDTWMGPSSSQFSYRQHTLWFIKHRNAYIIPASKSRQWSLARSRITSVARFSSLCRSSCISIYCSNVCPSSVDYEAKDFADLWVFTRSPRQSSQKWYFFLSGIYQWRFSGRVRRNHREGSMSKDEGGNAKKWRRKVYSKEATTSFSSIA